MGDFHQGSMITTVHRLKKDNTEQLEQTLLKHSRMKPVALVLPALFSDLQQDPARKILEVLKDVPYLQEVVVTLGRATAEEFGKARRIVSVLPQQTHLIWNDGPSIQRLYRLLEENGLTTIEDGKGRSAWIAYGHILARQQSEVIALHDCDVLTYDREFLARLVYPVVVPTMGYEFCKGYYSRVSHKIHGRVTRLFVFPLVKVMRQIFGEVPFLEFLDNFRYPLAGEFSMIAELARINRIPYDWGLEVGVLAEIFRNVSPKRICQVELCETYDHKHQKLSADDPSTGLMKMSIDIAKSIFRTLASEGVILSEACFKTLRSTYSRNAQDMIKRYNDNADINSLVFDRHEEGVAVEAFSRGLELAGDEFYEHPRGAPLIPNWNRVVAAIPDFFGQLVDAVEKDRSS
jgi:glucosyl-3-phosphoglycerate synthase